MSDFEAQQHDGDTSEPELRRAIRDYVRFVALGDSASCGVGDPTPGGWRGWARILADAIAADHHVSFCKLAVPGATVAGRGRLSGPPFRLTPELTPIFEHEGEEHDTPRPRRRR
jgi:hypothetical protein